MRFKNKGIFLTLIMQIKYNIVIPYSESGDKYKGEELRHSLRSLEMYGENYNEVFLVGDRPSWYKGNMIETDNGGYEYGNGGIFHKVCLGAEVAGDAIHWQDDYFLTKPCDFFTLPNYYREEDMLTTIKRFEKTNKRWSGTLNNSREYLLSKGLPTRMFDMHVPMLFKKEPLLEFRELDWTIPFQYGLKSLYGNSVDYPIEFLKDNKIVGQMNKHVFEQNIRVNKFISTCPYISDEIKKVLFGLYPHKSRFEI